MAEPRARPPSLNAEAAQPVGSRAQTGLAALACLIGSVRVLRQRTALSLALGAAVVLGLVASFCVVGALIAPWFICELLALLLGNALWLNDPAGENAPIERHGGWLGACVVLLGAVVLTASVGWLVGLGLSTESVAVDVAARIALPEVAWLLVPVSAVGALIFVEPFLYAPLLLIQQPRPVLSAMLESARMVRSAGMLSQLWLSVCAHVVQIAPLAIGSFAAHAFAGPELGSLWALLGLPFMALTIPLGQGMIAWSFAQQSQRAPEAPLRVRPAQLPQRAVLAIAMWCALVLSPLASFGMLGASLVRPSRVPSGQLPERIEHLGTLKLGDASAGAASFVVPATALTVRALRASVHVEASDGGGAGELPLRGDAPIDRVRVARTRDHYAIEIEQAGKHSITYVDRAGVRLDDDLRARLADRVPTWALAMMALALLATALVQLPVLAGLGRLLATGEPIAAKSPAVERALGFGLLLAPLAGVSLFHAVGALF